jgi:hypothetical protein
MAGHNTGRTVSPPARGWSRQWLIGRSLSDGFSQVIAITAQICSGVYVSGAPGRGTSEIEATAAAGGGEVIGRERGQHRQGR